MMHLTPLDWFWICSLFILGACVGSFLNVFIYRWPREMSVNNPPRSFCTTSNKPIPWYDNIPVISYLMLGGKSRFDGKPISIRYPIVEILTALIFVSIYLTTPHPFVVVVYLVMTSGLIAASFVDLETKYIPDEISISGIFLGIALSFACPELHNTKDHWHSLLIGLTGALAGAGSLWIIGELGSLVFKKPAMGLGDVKLLAGVGALLGPLSVPYIIMTASIFGTVIGISVSLYKKEDLRGSTLPFGPYLSLGILSWILGGKHLPAWYWNYINSDPSVALSLVAPGIFW
ncbi:MAG: prepilin peptidase [Verrucomicrobiota bacterium]|nr:prepilin peptidase [Verrucomicrobiota bacterium]